VQSEIQKAAKSYIARGWQIVPLAPGSKACKIEDWLKLKFKPEDFEEGDNIGLRSVDGLVDVDLDANEAVILAPFFLPKTNAIYGRPSKPSSHWLYNVETPPERTRALKDLAPISDDNAKTIIELRVNHQSMAPPSKHPGDANTPKGEQLSWKNDKVGDATKVKLVDLNRAVNLIATASLLARYYNPKSARHDWTLSMSGLFRELEITVTEAELLYKSVVTLVDEHDIEDRLNAIRATYAKADDEPVTGGKTLEEMMVAGTKFVASLRRIWSVESHGIPRSKLELLNEKHAVIFQQSGDLVLITEPNELRGETDFRVSNLDVMKQLYPQLVVMGYNNANRPMYKKLGAAWLESPRRRQYWGIELQPKNATEGYYNMWKGFVVEPKKGNWDLFREHIETVVCDRNPAIVKYVIGWLAHCVQEPDKPGATAIALRGGQGTGKSTFAKWFGGLFGRHFLHLDSTRHLTGHFNAHLHNAIVVFADEAAWPGDRAGLGALRRMVTEDTLTIERKGIDVFTVRNIIHLLLASNADWVIPAAMDERRFAVLDVSDCRRNDRQFFRAVHTQLFEQEGLAAMLHFLLDYKIDVDLSVIPKTKALYEQKLSFADAHSKWWYQALYNADYWEDGEEATIPRELMYDDFVDATDKAGHSPKGMQTQLGKFLVKVLPSAYPRTIRKQGIRMWVLPELKTCREHYESKFGITTEAEWPTEEIL
jgi:hypothetical protein